MSYAAYPPTYSFQSPPVQPPFFPTFYAQNPEGNSLFTDDIKKFVKKANDLYRDVVKNGEPKVPENKRYPTFTSTWNEWSRSGPLFNYVDNSWNINSRNNTTHVNAPPRGRFETSEERTEKEEKKEREKTAAIWGTVAAFICVIAFGYNYARYQNIKDDLRAVKNFEAKLIGWRTETQYPNHPHLERIENIYQNTVEVLKSRENRLWTDVMLTVSALAGSILIGAGGYLAVHTAITAGTILLTGTLIVAAGRYAYNWVRNDASKENAEEIHAHAMALKVAHTSNKTQNSAVANTRIIYYFDRNRWENQRDY